MKEERAGGGGRQGREGGREEKENFYTPMGFARPCIAAAAAATAVAATKDPVVSGVP